ncbi:MAG: hypothetical protein WDN49_09230 [Acetobacteraceae bacterium]
MPRSSSSPERAHDFGSPADCGAAHGLDLRAAEMGVHDAERGGEVRVVFGADERDLVLVPADLDRRLQRRAVERAAWPGGPADWCWGDSGAAP